MTVAGIISVRERARGAIHAPEVLLSPGDTVIVTMGRAGDIVGVTSVT